jgi:uncharacterized membrane-anchored protein YitT (DUF2179 family)
MKIELTPSEKLRDYTGIIFGSIIFGAAFSWFLFPFRISPGGIGGLSQVLSYLTQIPESIWMFAFNIPLFVLGWIFVGKQFGFRSFIGMFISTGMCWIFDPRHSWWVKVLEGQIHNIASADQLPRFAVFLTGQKETDILLASLAGSALLGLGLGLIFKFRGSTGGTDIPVAIMKKYLGVSISTGYWLVDSLIILFVGMMFRNPTLVIWAYLNLFLTTKMVDLAAEGMPSVKAILIISGKPDEIKEAIFSNLNRGLTFLKAEGGHNRDEKDVIYVCVHRRQVMIVQRIVKKIDPKAFIVLHDAYDVMGYGFRRRTIDYSDEE